VSSQLSAFLALAQTGQEMSQESLFGVTLRFTGQGNADGYAASTGPTIRQIVADNHGTLFEVKDKAFRIRRALFADDSVTIVEQKTAITVDGKGYRVDRIVDRPGDPCVYLACKEL
jgi:hypothetical protein